MFDKSREKWFRAFLDLPNGIPSHNTFRRVFNMLDPAAFAPSTAPKTSPASAESA